MLQIFAKGYYFNINMMVKYVKIKKYEDKICKKFKNMVKCPKIQKHFPLLFFKSHFTDFDLSIKMF